jgi:N-methylhydantoinase A/oxoprolinase/acetone carboxylase beta subunit
VHGTTIATNALLQGGDHAVGMLTTAGFRDVIEIRASFSVLSQKKLVLNNASASGHKSCKKFERVDSRTADAIRFYGSH